MSNNTFTLSPADLNAILLNDSNYINAKGAKRYHPGEYAAAVEYYHLAAAMGNVNAISNLGYCYLYGREIEQNLPLAMAYFHVAAMKENVDAAYKLGDIYGSDKWGVKDKELAVYFYRMAASYLIGENWEENVVVAWCTQLQQYPSLCYALGREMSHGGDMNTDLSVAYQFLKHAEIGYRKELNNGFTPYETCYSGVLKLLADTQFDEVRVKIDPMFDDDDEGIDD